MSEKDKANDTFDESTSWENAGAADDDELTPAEQAYLDSIVIPPSDGGAGEAKKEGDPAEENAEAGEEPAEDTEEEDDDTAEIDEESGADGGFAAQQPDGLPPKSDYDPALMTDSITHHLSGMYQSWFLDYASYVILERAVPHIMDGLKPVQRRILHSMKRMDDGRYNKVANIVGHTMQFHPHGDASIKDALVQMGQKNLLIDCQGNWGNILTGDDAAAGRYIEARLSRFALDVVFNPKTTEWKLSYDGRNKEPIALPVKFPLLLAQGAEGIAVGLSCKILPHNLNEICDAAISYLHGEDFQLFPDFPTGGYIDVSKYNDGQRGGLVRVRAKIEKRDSKTLAITEIPFGKTTGSPQHPSQFVDSILKAAEKGKIKVKKVEDMTAAGVEILIHLMPGVSSDKTIDALYAFTDCEINISPNCCVIDEQKPQFLTVSDVLRRSVDNTRDLIRRELEIRRGELLEQLHFASLEQIFIEQRIYKGKPFEEAPDMDAACAYVDARLKPFYPQLVREVTRDDILRLMEIKMARILKFNKERNEELIVRLKGDLADIERDLGNLTEVTAQWFRFLKEKYGADRPRLTQLRSFDTIQAATVAEANEKLYIDRAEGFIGTGLKKAEFVCNCSDIDDILLFYRDGTYKVVRVAEKLFVGETERSKAEKRKAEIIYVGVFTRNDRRTVYNLCYRDGEGGTSFIKRFCVTSLSLNREYDVTQGTPHSRVLYFSVNSNGEAETIRVHLRPTGRSKKLMFDKSFSEIPIHSRTSKGNILTRVHVRRVEFRAQGISTLGGRQVWYDPDVQRLNYDEHGFLLGEFQNDDCVLVLLPTGEFYLTNIDVNNHFEKDILRIEKYDAAKLWTAVLLDADNKHMAYMKRFLLDASTRRQSILTNPKSQLLLLTDTPCPRLSVEIAAPYADRGPLVLEADAFVAPKGFKAKGKRITTFAVDHVEELEPTHAPAAPSPAETAPAGDEDTQAEEAPDAETDSPTADNGKDATPESRGDSPSVIDETGQLSLF